MYTCDKCQKSFEKVTSYAGHRVHCGKKDTVEYKLSQEKRNKKLRHHRKENSNYCKAKYELWLNQERICEKCKIKFTLKERNLKNGSGRFCSRICANGRKLSEETKQKIRIQLKGRKIVDKVFSKKIKSCEVYFKKCINPKCNKLFTTSRETRKTCSRKCVIVSNKRKQKLSDKLKDAYKNGKPVYGGKTKWYDYINASGVNIRVQGSYELRVCSILDKWKSGNKILDWQYTKDRINYIDNDNKNHVYILDFKVVESNEKFYYIETKGYKTEKDELKWQAAREQNIDLRIWFYDDIVENELISV